MTPKEMLEDLETCTGPCGRMCLSCPESRYVAEIYDVIKQLIDENERLRKALSGFTAIKQLIDENERLRKALSGFTGEIDIV